jgi:hypothetical protein
MPDQYTAESLLWAALGGAIAAGPLGDRVDVPVHDLTELLGDPHLIAAPVSSARSMVALVVAPNAVPEHGAPEASAASRTILNAIVPHRPAGGAL